MQCRCFVYRISYISTSCTLHTRTHHERVKIQGFSFFEFQHIPTQYTHTRKEQHNMYPLLFVVVLLVIPVQTKSRIIEMTSENFEDVLDANDFTFVLFHADPSISWHYFKDVEKSLDALDSLITKRAAKNYGIVLATANVKKHIRLSTYSKKETLHAVVFSNDPVNFPPMTYRGSFVAMHMYNFVDAMLNRIGASYEVGTDSFVRDAVDEFVKARFGGDLNEEDEEEKRNEKVNELRTRFEKEVKRIEEEEQESEVRILALNTFVDAFRDVAYNSASLSANVNTIRRRLANEQDTLTFEQRLDLSAKLKVWQYFADSVMRGGAKDHENVNNKFVGEAADDYFLGGDLSAKMEVTARGEVLE